jgi:hypothetical protein
VHEHKPFAPTGADKCCPKCKRTTFMSVHTVRKSWPVQEMKRCRTPQECFTGVPTEIIGLLFEMRLPPCHRYCTSPIQHLVDGHRGQGLVTLAMARTSFVMLKAAEGPFKISASSAQTYFLCSRTPVSPKARVSEQPLEPFYVTQGCCSAEHATNGPGGRLRRQLGSQGLVGTLYWRLKFQSRSWSRRNRRRPGLADSRSCVLSH